MILIFITFSPIESKVELITSETSLIEKSTVIFSILFVCFGKRALNKMASMRKRNRFIEVQIMEKSEHCAISCANAVAFSSICCTGHFNYE